MLGKEAGLWNGLVGMVGGVVGERWCGDGSNVCSHLASLHGGALEVGNGIRCAGEWHDRWLSLSHAATASGMKREMGYGGDQVFCGILENLGAGALITARQIHCGGECDAA